MYYKYDNLSNDYYRLQHEYNIYDDENNLIHKYLFNKDTYYDENLDPILHTGEDFCICFKKNYKKIKLNLQLHRHNRHGIGNINLEINDENDNFINIDYIDKNYGNKEKIESNLGKIDTNTDNISSNLGKITTNEGNISSNLGKITTNEGDIASNLGKIGDNKDDIASNLETINDIKNDMRNQIYNKIFYLENQKFLISSGQNIKLISKDIDYSFLNKIYTIVINTSYHYLKINNVIGINHKYVIFDKKSHAIYAKKTFYKDSYHNGKIIIEYFETPPINNINEKNYK